MPLQPKSDATAAPIARARFAIGKARTYTRTHPGSAAVPIVNSMTEIMEQLIEAILNLKSATGNKS